MLQESEFVYEGTVPARPDVPAPRKRGRFLIAAAVIGGLVLAGGMGAIAKGSNETPTPSAPVAVVNAPVETGTTISEAATESVPLATDAVDEFDAALTAINAYDLDGAADHTEGAADDYASISAIWFGVDQYISDTNSEIANELYAAADDLRAMRIDSSTGHVETATGLIGDVTAYMKTLV